MRDENYRQVIGPLYGTDLPAVPIYRDACLSRMRGICPEYCFTFNKQPPDLKGEKWIEAFS